MSQRMSLFGGFFGEQKTPGITLSDRDAEAVSPRSISIPILKSTLGTGNTSLHGRKICNKDSVCPVLTDIPDGCENLPEIYRVYSTNLEKDF